MLRLTFVTLYFAVFCYGVSQGQFGPQKYEIEEEPSKQTSPYATRTILAPRPAYDQNQQLNQYYLGQQAQAQAQTQAQFQPQAQPQSHQYLAALQQYYAASRQPQNAYQTAPQTQNYAQPAPQQNYPQPLGVLYSAASDVSQFQFSGNGVNYSF